MSGTMSPGGGGTSMSYWKGCEAVYVCMCVCMCVCVYVCVCVRARTYVRSTLTHAVRLPSPSPTTHIPCRRPLAEARSGRLGTLKSLYL